MLHLIIMALILAAIIFLIRYFMRTGESKRACSTDELELESPHKPLEPQQQDPPDVEMDLSKADDAIEHIETKKT
jgi:cytochrome c-type biogenesis protein CcmH/NrfG